MLKMCAEYLSLYFTKLDFSISKTGGFVFAVFAYT